MRRDIDEFLDSPEHLEKCSYDVLMHQTIYYYYYDTILVANIYY